MPGSKLPGVPLFHLLGLFDLYLTEQNKSRLFVLLAVNILSISSPTFDPYICLGAHGSSAGSKKDPSAAGEIRFYT